MNGRSWFVSIVGIAVLFVFLIVLILLIGFPFGSGHETGMSLVTWILLTFGVIFLVAIVLAMVISAITWGQWLGDFRLTDRDEECKPNISETALQILDERFARGEISREEYSRAKDELRIGRRRRR